MIQKLIARLVIQFTRKCKNIPNALEVCSDKTRQIGFQNCNVGILRKDKYDYIVIFIEDK